VPESDTPRLSGLSKALWGLYRNRAPETGFDTVARATYSTSVLWCDGLTSHPTEEGPPMFSSFIPPRRVTIGDAASLLGTTADVIRRYHESGLLPEPERDGDDRRGYGHDDIIRLLWIRAMADAGMAVDDIRDAVAAPTGAEGDDSLAAIPGRMALLSDVVAGRLTDLPEGSLRQADLDILLVTERIFGPLGAAVQATRFIALATQPGLREQSDRVDAAEEALDDTVAVDDPRVARVAGERHAFELALNAVIDGSGLAEGDSALFDSWEATRPAIGADESDRGSGTGEEPMSLAEAVGMMPYDFSPARLRCMELAGELAARE
jgi:DNA-binding transcriptional MerR regulator